MYTQGNDLGKIRVGRRLRKLMPKPVRRIVRKVTPLIPGAVVFKGERRKLRKMVPKPIRAIAKRIAPLVIPSALVFAPTRKTAARMVRGAVRPVIGRRKPSPPPVSVERPVPSLTIPPGETGEAFYQPSTEAGWQAAAGGLVSSGVSPEAAQSLVEQAKEEGKPLPPEAETAAKTAEAGMPLPGIAYFVLVGIAYGLYQYTSVPSSRRSSRRTRR